MEKLLSGVRIIALEVGLAGPFASMILGDLGAEVIKIEPPEGDATRDLEEARRRMVSPTSTRGHFYFLAHNRSKKSVVLDLGTPLGKGALFDLIKHSDVLLCNFRAGALARLGADYETVKKLNPRIIVCNMTGFGSSGPYKDRPCYDLTGYGWSGMLSICGEPGRKPIKPGSPIGDYGVGLYAIAGILSALYKRSQTGEGCQIEVSLLDACIGLMSSFYSKYFATGEVPGPIGSAHLSVAPSGVYRTKNGYVALSTCWPRICRVIDAEWMIEDPRFSTLTARVKNRDELDRIIEERLVQADTDQWVELFAVEDIPGAPVNTVDKAARDPQVLHNNMVLTFDDPSYDQIKVAGNPIKVVGVKEEYLPPPDTGEHSYEIFSQLLGYSQEQIKQLEEEQKHHARELEDRLHKKL